VPPDALLDLDAALAWLEQEDTRSVGLVKLRVFAGMAQDRAADALGVVRRSVGRDWAVAWEWRFRSSARSS
jgi:hypothetical protein